MRGAGLISARLIATATRLRADTSLAIADAGLFLVAELVVFVLVGSTNVGEARAAIGVAAAAPAVVVLMNMACGLYGQIWRHASVHEARRLVIAAAMTAGVLTAADFVTSHLAALPATLCAVSLWTILAGGVRFQSRLFALQRRVAEPRGLRIAVLGGGYTGAILVRDLLNSSRAGLIPVAVLDDDVRLRGRRLAGVPVVGSLTDLPTVVESLDIDQVVLAMSRPPSALVRRVEQMCASADVCLRVMPSVSDLVTGRPSFRDLRDLQIEDILGREPVEVDLVAVRRTIAGRRVLITGAGGSIGAEIARQIAQCDPSCLVLLDHDETHLHDACTTLAQPAVQVLADIRDANLVARVFERYRPGVVFHAAAHKHVPLLEMHPCEAVLSNVLGTANVVRSARNVGVERFVFISTDKAVRPTSVMGASKFIGEQIVLAHAAPGRQYAAVRFGNVLGSRGSVVPTFLRQIEAGGPVTVTDPRMSRYFMSVAEAVQLVLQAAAFATGAEIFMLEMGEPIPIVQLAERMIRLAGRRVGADVEIRIVGARAGEKLHEELRLPEEDTTPTSHPSIVRLHPSHIPSERLAANVDKMIRVATSGDDEAARAALQELVKPALEVRRAHRRINLARLEEEAAWSQLSI